MICCCMISGMKYIQNYCYIPLTLFCKISANMYKCTLIITIQTWNIKAIPLSLISIFSLPGKKYYRLTFLKQIAELVLGL